MKITLKNFRHHRKGEFTIPEQGLVLLSGESGAGKSTILNAIIHGLFGTVRKPYSHGTKSCEVQLQIKGMEITRSNSPNRLLVKYKDVIYEDDAAQGLIEGVLDMNSKEFKLSSYVVQSLHNSVISLTPTEQAKFIETLAFSDDLHLEYRQRFKAETKEAKITLSKIEGQISLLEMQLEEKLVELPEDPPDIEEYDIETVKAKQKTMRETIKQNSKEIGCLTKERKKIQTQETIENETNEKIKMLETEVSHYSHLQSNLGEPKTDDEIDAIEEALAKVRTDVEHTKGFEEHTSKKKQIATFKEEHTSNINKKIKALQSQLPPKAERDKLGREIEGLEEKRKAFEEGAKKRHNVEFTKEQNETTIATILSEVKKLIPRKFNRVKKLESLIRVLRTSEKAVLLKIGGAEKQILTTTQSITKNELTAKSLHCPSCDTQLKLDENGSLVEVKKADAEASKPKESVDLEEKLEKLQTTLSESGVLQQKLAGFIETLAGLESSTEDDKNDKKGDDTDAAGEYNHEFAIELEKKSMNYKRIEEELKELRSQKTELPKVVVDLLAEVKKLSISFPKKFKISSGLPEIEARVQKLQAELEEAWKGKSEYAILSREISTRKKKLRLLRKNTSKGVMKREKKTVRGVDEEISDIQLSIIQLTGEVVEIQEIIELIGGYEAYQKQLKSAEKTEEDLKNTQDQLKAAERRLQGALGLEEAGKEAEILAMRSTIESINERAKGYLENMFEDDMCIRLEGHKTTSKGAHRTQMNTYIEYKGSVYSSIDELSGGETQRCELAFLLAVNDMLGSGMILLDECLNNLDAEINMEVLNHLKEVGSEKLILVVSHEAVQGVFDEVISI